MRAYMRVFMALSLGMIIPSTTKTQDLGKKLDEIYKDETHCLLGPEIRSEKDKPISCYSRDAHGCPICVSNLSAFAEGSKSQRSFHNTGE